MWLGMAFMIHVTSVGGGQLTPEGWRACPSKKWTLDLQFPVTVSCLVFVGQQISTGWQWCLWKTQAIYVLADDLIDACWTVNEPPQLFAWSRSTTSSRFSPRRHPRRYSCDAGRSDCAQVR
eukprot:s489_g9.t1